MQKQHELMITYRTPDLQNIFAKTTWIDDNIQDAGPTKHIRKNNINWWYYTGRRTYKTYMQKQHELMIIYRTPDLQNVYAKTTWIDDNIEDAGPTKHIRKNNMNWWEYTGRRTYKTYIQKQHELMIIYRTPELQNIYTKTTWLDDNIQDAEPTKHRHKNNMNW